MDKVGGISVQQKHHMAIWQQLALGQTCISCYYHDGNDNNTQGPALTGIASNGTALKGIALKALTQLKQRLWGSGVSRRAPAP
jgi:hypothetical protein